MADKDVQFGTSSQFGTQTGWVAQSPQITVESQRASELGPNGDEAVSKLHDEKTTCSQDFASASSSSAPTVPPSLGALLGSYICTSIGLTTKNNEVVKMALEGHNHTTNPHVGDVLKVVDHGITLSKAFGAIDFLGGTAGDNATVDNSTLQISCQHRDRMNGDGENCVGQNYDARIVVTVVWLGVPTTPVGAGLGWGKVSSVTAPNNEDFLMTTVRAEKALTMSAP